MKCPDCGSESLRRSHRQDIERFLGWICPIVPFICKDCWRRFWAVKSPLQSWASKITAGITLFLIALLLLTPHPVSRRSVSRPSEGLYQDRRQSKTLLPNTYTAKISRQSNYKKKVFLEQISSSPSLNITRQVKRPAESLHVAVSVVPALATLGTQSRGELVETRIPEGAGEGLNRFYYSIQIESYRNLAKGKERTAELITENGLYAWLRKVRILEKGEWYRLYVGKKKSKAEALSLGKRLKAARIIDKFFVHKHKETKPEIL